MVIGFHRHENLRVSKPPVEGCFVGFSLFILWHIFFLALFSSVSLVFTFTLAAGEAGKSISVWDTVKM